MKNRMTRCGKRLAVFAAAVLSLAGCSDDRKSEHPAIWDFVNPSVRFVVTDAETGENLLDPASENFIGEESVAELPKSLLFVFGIFRIIAAIYSTTHIGKKSLCPFPAIMGSDLFNISCFYCFRKDCTGK